MLVALVVVVGGFYFAVTKGVELIKDQFASAPRTTPGPATARSPSRCTQGDTHRRDRPQPEGRGRGRLGRRLHRRRGRRPDSTGIQVGFYQLKKEMKAADAARGPGRPGNLSRTRSPIRRGCGSPRSSTLLAEQTDFAQGRSSRRCSRTPARSGCPRTPTATPRATCSRRPTTSGPTTTPDDDAHGRWSTRWQQAADDADLEDAAAELGYTPGRADDHRQPGRGRGPRRRHAARSPG